MKQVLFGTALGLVLGVLFWPAKNMPGPTVAESSDAARSPAADTRVAAAPGSSAASAARALASVPGAGDAQSMIDKVAALNACYTSNTCNYPRTDPRSYGFAVGQDLKTVIFNLAATARGQGIKSPELAAMARAELKNDDGHVQEAALALMATQDPSEENLDSVLNDVIGGTDSLLIQTALVELRRYDSDADHDKIANALSSAMASGSTFVGKQVATAISPFLYSRDLPVYEGALAGMPDGSIIKTDLSRNLAMAGQ